MPGRSLIQRQFVIMLLLICTLLIPLHPTLADGPNPQPADATVNVATLNMRAGPDTTFAILEKLTLGLSLTLTGRTDNNLWVAVTTPTGSTGWVMTPYITIYADLDTRPIIQPGEQPPSGQQPPANSPGTAAPQTGPTAYPASLADLLSPDAPLISNITPTAHEIFQRGQELGMRPDVFIKVGDSISLTPNFLHAAGYGGYDLSDWAYLEDVIQFYQTAELRTGNSFTNDSVATNTTWTAGHALRVGDFPPHTWGNIPCSEQEFPLACEIRLSQPAVAIIMFGTNGTIYTTPELFAGHMNEIVGFCAGAGVIPVLTTIPFNTEGGARVATYNRIIRDTAALHDTPLIDYWTASELLPNRGVSGDQLHPTGPTEGNSMVFSPENLQTGYTVRNLLTLQMLDRLWREVIAPQ